MTKEDYSCIDRIASNERLKDGGALQHFVIVRSSKGQLLKVRNSENPDSLLFS